MSDQISKPGFIWGLIFLAAGWVVACLVSRKFNRKNGPRDIHLSFFSNPVSNLLAIIAFGLPALVGVTASLYRNRPEEDYSGLLTSIAGLLLVIAIAFWLTFSLLSKASSTEVVHLELPQERHFITAMGAIYALMFVVFGFTIKFFLLDLSPIRPRPRETRPLGTVTLSRPALKLDSTRWEVEEAWGEPLAYDGATRRYFYQSTDSNISLEFDRDWKLTTIQETRRRTTP